MLAYYCEVVDITVPFVDMILVHYQVKNDVGEVVTSGEYGYSNMVPLVEGERERKTDQAKRQSLTDELNAFFKQTLANLEEADEHVDKLRDALIGYRFPSSEVRTKGA